MAAKSTSPSTKLSATTSPAPKRAAQGNIGEASSAKKTDLGNRDDEISFFMSSPAMNDNGLMKPDRGIHTMLEALEHVKDIFKEIELANQQMRGAAKKAESVANIISTCLGGAGFVLERQQVERLINVKQNLDSFVCFAKAMNKPKEQSTTKIAIKLEQ